MLTIHNPHSVLATIKSRPSDVVEIAVSSQKNSDDAWSAIIEIAKNNGIKITEGNRKVIKEIGPGRTSGSHAVIKEKEPVSIEELFSKVKESSSKKPLFLALDSLQDPQNVGAIFRTAAFFGVQGIVITAERSAPLTSTVYDVASGGMEAVPFTLQTNLKRALEVAKNAGLWILGSSEHAHDSYLSIALDRPWLLVLGSEETGMRRLTEEACDLLCSIPPQGKVTSLNVSVAASVLIARLSGNLA